MSASDVGVALRLWTALRLRGLRALMRLPAGLVRPALLVPERVAEQPLDVHTRWFLTLLKLDRADRGGLSVPRQRHEVAVAELTLSGPLRDVLVDDLTVPLPGRALRARRFRPRTPGPWPGLLYLHGGGWVTGDLDSYTRACARLCEEAGALVLALDYRLAPEHPFPAAPDDVRDAWRWLRAHAASLGADPERLAVGGDSAGGNLSAVLCNELAPEEAPRLQVLVYPGTDMAAKAPSRARFADGFFLTDSLIDWFVDHYAPDAAKRADPRLSPLRAPGLGRVPALLVLAGLDPLVDEGRAYGRRLEDAGAPVEWMEVPGMVHGFVTLDGVLPVADAAMARLGARLRARLRE